MPNFIGNLCFLGNPPSKDPERNTVLNYHYHIIKFILFKVASPFVYEKVDPEEYFLLIQSKQYSKGITEYIVLETVII